MSANQFFCGLRQGDEHRIQIDRGVQLIVGLEAISDPDERGLRTVMCIINGQLRPVVVRDRNIADIVPTAEKADRTNPDHIAAPFAGVVTIGVAVGDEVTAGQTIATIEAMKMEAAITAHKAGVINRVAVATTAQVEGGDLLAVICSVGRSEAAGGQTDPDRRRRGGRRRLAVPPRGTRPTTELVREALFNALVARLDFDGLRVLDLYAGSGALGLEALSRERAGCCSSTAMPAPSR